MATAPILTEPQVTEFEDYVLTDTLTLEQILSGENLATRLNEHTLNKIGQAVIRDVETDETSRGDWSKRNEKNIKIAMQVKAAKTFPWSGAANSKSPILTVASIQFNAEAYPVIVDGSNLVKGRVLGPDPDGTKRSRADRIGQHMTWQLLYKMPGWEEETDKLLLMLPIVGCMFRKTYYDSVENANRSDIVSGEDFIINYWAKSIETAPRYTQVLHYYPYEVKEFVSAGLWQDVPTDDDEASSDDEQALGDYYEQHRCEDLDGDGYPEHYVVTCTKEGKIARIVPCFGPENITVMVLGPNGPSGQTVKLDEIAQAAEQDEAAWDLAGQIVKIERRQYFTKYGFIPAPDGSFYDIGFGDLLENTTDIIDTLQNQMLDAATLANAQGGFIGSGINIRGGNFRFASVGEWKRVETTGGTLRDNIMPLPANGPSPVSFSLLELLMSMAKDITSSQDVVAGRAPPNQPATTTLALIEQASSVKKGILKRIWRSFGQELRILFRLNRDYLDEEEYFQLNDPQPEMGEDGPMQGPDGQPMMTQVAKVGREDYADSDLDVIPVSDPSQVSDTHKMARAQATFQTFNGDPLINQKLIREDMLQAIGARDIQRYFDVPKPSPDPKLVLEALKEARAKIETQAKVRASDAQSAQKLIDAAQTAFEMGLFTDAESLAAAAEQFLIRTEHEDGQGDVSGMEGPGGDQGVPGLPEAEAGPFDGGMGEGASNLPGGAGPGGPAGPVGSGPV